MNGAPAVTYPVGRSRFQGQLVVIASVLGVFVGMLWFLQAAPITWRQPVFALVLTCASYMAWRQWRDSQSGSLRWDGQSWTWNGPGFSATGFLTIHLDLQFCLLLCFHSQRDGRIWLWPQRADRTERWLDLRRAVYASVPADELATTVPDHDMAGR